jgi:hypothetical protein
MRQRQRRKPDQKLVLDLRPDLEFLAGKQPNAAVVFNAGVPSFGGGAKDRPQGDGAGEGKSGYAPPEGAEGGSLRAGECAPDSGGFEFGLSPARGLPAGSTSVGRGHTGVGVESRIKLGTSTRRNRFRRKNRALHSKKHTNSAAFSQHGPLTTTGSTSDNKPAEGGRESLCIDYCAPFLGIDTLFRTHLCTRKCALKPQ